MSHDGCTAEFKPDHRWDEDDPVCKIRKFYGPKRAITSQGGLIPQYTQERCAHCGWVYWRAISRPSHMCPICYRDTYYKSRTCPRCGSHHTDRAVVCKQCRSSQKRCLGCGGPVGSNVGDHCGPCYIKTIDPIKLKAQRRRSGNARRARKQAAQVAGPVSMRVYREVVESGDCVYCGAEADTVDHIQPLARGGHEAEYNLVPACDYCNSSKCASPLTDWHHQELVRHAVRHSPKVAAVWAQLTGATA